MKKKESADEKSMMEIAQINRKLSEPLKKSLKDVEELRMDLKNYDRVRLEHVEFLNKLSNVMRSRIKSC